MEFRALYPKELEAWLDHVTTVFTGGRQYFSNHWHNDPWRDPEGIRVAVDNGTIVSTVRVFIRKMFLHGEPITVGGIGEVSTRSEYRRRGLATQLLKDSIEFMEDRGIAISSLHGSQRIYSVEGWQTVPRYYAKAIYPGKKQQTWDIRPVNFQDQDEVKQLAALYDTYSRKFNGTFVRDEIAYWRDWVQTAVPNTWVAEKEGNIQGYISVHPYDSGELSVKEFAPSEVLFARDRGKLLFESLLSHIIAQMNREALEVIYAAPIADGFHASEIEERRGTMYRVIDPSKIPKQSESVVDLLQHQPESLAQAIPSHHIFWTTDGF